MHKYSVLSNQRLTSSTSLLTIQIDEKEKRPFSFQPGQYAAISFKNRGRPTAARCFSIVSSPTQADTLQFSMRTNGRFTKSLSDLMVGDEVDVRGPFGGFVFDQERDKEVILLAGGIGITPFMSMLRYVSAVGLNNKITLILSCKNQEDIPFLDILKKLKIHNRHFRVIYVLGHGPANKLVGESVATGRITAELIDHVTNGNYKYRSFFVCGPQSFMKAMNRILHEKGAPDHKVMTEAFSQGPNRQTGKIRSWPFNIYVMSAVGVALGSFVVMVSDLLKTVPASSILNSSNSSQLSALTNSRQSDLDQLVNGLPEVLSTAPASDAVNAAQQQTSTPTPATVIQTTPVQANPTIINPTVTVPTTKTTPKCITSQSGIKTCV